MRKVDQYQGLGQGGDIWQADWMQAFTAFPSVTHPMVHVGASVAMHCLNASHDDAHAAPEPLTNVSFSPHGVLHAWTGPCLAHFSFR
jgi:hypothetical protein